MHRWNCVVEKCPQPVYARADRLCHHHWHAKRAGLPLVALNLAPDATCCAPRCEDLVYNVIRQLCRRHYSQWTRGAQIGDIPVRSRE